MHPRVFTKIPNYKSWGFCSCGGEFIRSATGPTSQLVESVDNGAMRKSIERLADIERLAKDRSTHSDPSQKKDTFV